jgi:hypothetical protein
MRVKSGFPLISQTQVGRQKLLKTRFSGNNDSDV